MNTARKGRRFEHEIKHVLEAAGYSVVRGASSKGEFFEHKVDLVATRQTSENIFRVEILGFQLKVKKRTRSI